MSKLYLLPLFLAGALTVQAAEREISSFKDEYTTQGKSVNIGGTEYSEPDIYYIPDGNGKYKAVRLSVAPVDEMSDFTLPYLNLATTNSIQVNWKTSKKPAKAIVLYGSAKDKLDKTATATTTSINSDYNWNTAVLTGLQPDTPYFYQVVSDDKKSEVYRFRSQPDPSANKKIRVLLLGDHQRNERSDYEWLINCARRTVAEKYGEGPIEDYINLVMNCGDQVDGGNLTLYEKIHLYKSRSVSPVLPIMTAVGNHETYGDDKLELYDGHFNTYGKHMYKGISSGNSGYYAYRVGCVLFVVLNSDRTGIEQKFWLRKIISLADSDPDVSFIVSVQHRPLYAEQWCNDVSEWMMKDALPILSSSSKHVLNFSGHHHLYARGQVTNSAAYHMISGGGVGTSANGYEQLWGETPDNYDHGEVQKTLDHWTYQIAEFDPTTKTMSVECYSVGNRRIALDNKKVDSFSLDLTQYSYFGTPSFQNSTLKPNLPYTFKQSNPPAGIHSANYQISTTPGFDNIVKDIVVTAENYYGVDGDFMPVDINEKVPVSELKLAADALPAGTYYIRVRNRNANLRWSTFSTSMEFTSTSSKGAKATLTADHRFYRTGSKVIFTFDGAPTGTNAWIGVYEAWKKPDIYNGGQNSNYWIYTDEARGKKWEITPEPKAYYATLFKDEGYTEISDRVYFVVSPNCDDNNRPNIYTDKKIYEVGEPVELTFSNAPGIEGDWIGMYKLGVLEDGGFADCYVYTDQKKDGTVKLNVEDNNNYDGPAEEGTYVISYFIAYQYYEPVERETIIIGKPVMIDTSADRYGVNDYISVFYDNAPAWESDKIVIYDSKGNTVTERKISTVGGNLYIGRLPIDTYQTCYVSEDGKEISPRKQFVVAEDSGLEDVGAQGVSLSVDGRTVSLTTPGPVGVVRACNMSGQTVYTHDFGNASTASFEIQTALGIYIVSTSNGVVRKLIIR